VRQIRIGNAPKSRSASLWARSPFRAASDHSRAGTAFVVYEDLSDAKSAFEHLNGFHLQERYIVLLFYSREKQQEKDLARREEELAKCVRPAGA
jgi:hypothetical protein